MQTVNISIPEQKPISYQIFIGQNICDKINEVIKELPSQKAVLVTNTTIFGIYKNLLENIQKMSDIDIDFCILEDGERYKNKASWEKILKTAFDYKLERNDLFIAFGGGVTGDITGFAASIYLRGINFIQIPTTILAQVDSSVGGKVAINTSYGKNLLGAFYQPKAVITDLSLLKTLPKREILTGLAEVIKYAFIEKTCGDNFRDFAKFLDENTEKILNLNFDTLSEMIKISCELKAAIVNQDEKEQGVRAILNFGHTIGHAIEKCTNYNTFTHGEAVALGMKAILKTALTLNSIDQEYYNFAVTLLEKFGLNYKIPKDISPESIIEALIFDKKVKNGKIRFIVPTNYAQVRISDNVPQEVILKSIRELY